MLGPLWLLGPCIERILRPQGWRTQRDRVLGSMSDGGGGTRAVYLLSLVPADETEAYDLAHWRLTQQVIEPQTSPLQRDVLRVCLIL